MSQFPRVATRKRNASIKRALVDHFGKGKVRVRAGRGTAYGWVYVDLDITPASVEAATSLREQVLALIEGAKIELDHHYGDGPETDKRPSIIVQSRRDAITAAAVAAHQAIEAGKKDW